MAKRVGVDKWLFGTVLLLVLIGLAMVFSASAVTAKDQLGSPYAFVAKQALWALLGLVALAVLMQVDYKRYNSYPVVVGAVAVTTLLLLAVFAMHGMNGAHRWIRVAGQTVQPSEIAKPVIVLFLAYFLQTRIHAMEDWKGTILRAAMPPLVFIALILKEPDLGTALVCAGVTALMLYLAGAQLKYFFVAAALASPVLYYMLFHVAFRRARMLAFVNPELDPKGAGFHITQSLIAVGTGGVWGRGFMEGVQKLYYLPEPHTDFIFAVTAEEVGLVGALIVVLLFAVFLWRGIRTALRTENMFGRFLAVGITSMIVVQAFINISVVLGMMPTKGIPLPLVSYGGSSLLVTLGCIGVLLNISKQAE
jgi:cell division protein FtsW